LLESILNYANLEQADFRTAYNYFIDPETKFIKNAKFSFDGVKRFLDKYKIEIEQSQNLKKINLIAA